MKKDMTQMLVESTIRRTLKNIQESPERAIRNLVDLGLEFSNGAFQTRLLTVTQQMLHNQNSAYYALAKDVAAFVNPDIITTFGVNLGYNGCTKGAKIIREIEAQRHFNIPWSLSLAVNEKKLDAEPDFYPSLLDQGVSMGIHTYLFSISGNPEKMIPLLQKRPDCAFILFLQGSRVTNSFLQKMEGIHNTAISVYVNDDMPEACGMLRDARMLYAADLQYTEQDKDRILGGEWLASLLPFHPVFAILRADSSCPAKTQEEIYDYVLSVRDGQKYPVLLMDLKQDMLLIDKVVSDDVCLAGFNADGTLRTHEGSRTDDACNIFYHSLEEILQTTMEK